LIKLLGTKIRLAHSLDFNQVMPESG